MTDNNFYPLRIVHSEAATSFGGQERRIFKEMVAMRNKGHHMEAICQPDAQLANRLQQEGFKVHLVSMDGAINYLKGLWKIRRILVNGQFHVLNTHSRRDTMLAGVAARMAKTPLIVRTRHLARKPNSLISYTGIPHKVTTSSEHVRKLLIEKNVNPNDVATIYSPVDITPSKNKGVVRNQLGLADNDVIVGCVAVLRRPKGHKELIDAMVPLFAHNNKLHLVVVGGGEKIFDEIKSYVQKLNLEKKVHLMGARDDVPDLLADFDIFALATREEASGTVFVEAGAAGLPIVATNVGGVSETFVDGETGFLVDLDNIEALTLALKKLIDNPELRDQMGAAGLNFYNTSGRFTTHGLVQKTQECYYRWLKELSS